MYGVLELEFSCMAVSSDEEEDESAEGALAASTEVSGCGVAVSFVSIFGLSVESGIEWGARLSASGIESVSDVDLMEVMGIVAARFVPAIDSSDVVRECVTDREIDNDPGAEGVTYRANEAMARKRPRAGFVMENSGRSWHAPAKHHSGGPERNERVTYHHRSGSGRWSVRTFLRYRSWPGTWP